MCHSVSTTDDFRTYSLFFFKGEFVNAKRVHSVLNILTKQRNEFIVRNMTFQKATEIYEGSEFDKWSVNYSTDIILEF